MQQYNKDHKHHSQAQDTRVVVGTCQGRSDREWIIAFWYDLLLQQA